MAASARLRSMSRKDSISEDEMVLRAKLRLPVPLLWPLQITTDIKEANFFGRSEALREGGGPSPVG